MLKLTTIVLVAAPLLLSSAAIAQNSARQNQSSNDGQSQSQSSSANSGPSTARPSSSVELEALLDRVAASAGKEFVVSAEVPPRIPVRGTSLDNPSYPVLLAILQADGLAAVEIQGRIHIVRDEEVRQMPVPLVQADDASIPDEECVSRILTVTNINPAGLVPVLRPLMPRWAHLAAIVDPHANQTDVRGGKLVMTDTYANVKRITALVRELTQ